MAATENATAWQLTVSDNGIGIDAAQRERVFEIFQRLHSRKAYQGTGMGLATCSRIAALHGGSIGVDAADGGGSRFHVVLPKPIADSEVTE